MNNNFWSLITILIIFILKVDLIDFRLYIGIQGRLNICIDITLTSSDH